MKIGVNQKQLNFILQEIEKDVSEQTETAVSAEPSAGTSATQSGGQGYPQVGKWESGVSRGPANQIGNTKWSDIVGSVLKRDKANKLT